MFCRRFLSIFVSITFLANSFSLRAASAQSILNLLQPGSMVALSADYVPVLIKGLKINPHNPLSLDFIVATGNDLAAVNDRSHLKQESEKLIKYFFAALTLPEKDVWVNLSPYERNRIVPKLTGDTQMGRDMLAQDYLLKQMTASLIYPEGSLGKEFWDKVYAEAAHRFGTTQVPVNTFNKVWIVADKASVYEAKDTVLVVDAHLKVMLEEDYLSMEKHDVGARHAMPSFSSQIVKEIVLPALEREVNTGKNFANLRQIFHSIILAKWYKETLKTALLNQIYSDKNKIQGLQPSPTRGHVPREAGYVSPSTMPSKLSNEGESTPGKSLNDVEYIYQQYLQAYKKGVFNYIKEDIDKTSHQPMPRKYFSGGVTAAMAVDKAPVNEAMKAIQHWSGVNFMVGVDSRFKSANAGMRIPDIGDINRASTVLQKLRELNKGKEFLWAHNLIYAYPKAKRNILLKRAVSSRLTHTPKGEIALEFGFATTPTQVVFMSQDEFIEFIADLYHHSRSRPAVEDILNDITPDPITQMASQHYDEYSPLENPTQDIDAPPEGPAAQNDLEEYHHGDPFSPTREEKEKSNAMTAETPLTKRIIDELNARVKRDSHDEPRITISYHPKKGRNRENLLAAKVGSKLITITGNFVYGFYQHVNTPDEEFDLVFAKRIGKNGKAKKTFKLTNRRHSTVRDLDGVDTTIKINSAMSTGTVMLPALNDLLHVNGKKVGGNVNNFPEVEAGVKQVLGAVLEEDPAKFSPQNKIYRHQTDLGLCTFFKAGTANDYKQITQEIWQDAFAKKFNVHIPDPIFINFKEVKDIILYLAQKVQPSITEKMVDEELKPGMTITLAFNQVEAYEFIQGRFTPAIIDEYPTFVKGVLISADGRFWGSPREELVFRLKLEGHEEDTFLKLTTQHESAVPTDMQGLNATIKIESFVPAAAVATYQALEKLHSAAMGAPKVSVFSKSTIFTPKSIISALLSDLSSDEPEPITAFGQDIRGIELESYTLRVGTNKKDIEFGNQALDSLVGFVQKHDFKREGDFLIWRGVGNKNDQEIFMSARKWIYDTGYRMAKVASKATTAAMIVLPKWAVGSNTPLALILPALQTRRLAEARPIGINTVGQLQALDIHEIVKIRGLSYQDAGIIMKILLNYGRKLKSPEIKDFREPVFERAYNLGLAADIHQLAGEAHRADLDHQQQIVFQERVKPYFFVLADNKLPEKAKNLWIVLVNPDTGEIEIMQRKKGKEPDASESKKEIINVKETKEESGIGIKLRIQRKNKQITIFEVDDNPVFLSSPYTFEIVPRPQPEPAAAAMLSNPTRGGIDFNASKIQMQKSGAGMDIQFNQAMLAQFRKGNFDGIDPVITNITPIADVLSLVGLK